MKALKKFFKKVMEILHIISSDYNQIQDDRKSPRETLPEKSMLEDAQQNGLDSAELLAPVSWWKEEDV